MEETSTQLTGLQCWDGYLEPYPQDLAKRDWLQRENRTRELHVRTTILGNVVPQNSDV